MNSQLSRLPGQILIISVLGLVLSACGSGSGGSVGVNNTSGNTSTAFAAKIIPPGAICPNGGVEIESGIDDNGNGVLDTVEVDDVSSICHGEDGVDGSSTLINIVSEPVGANCSAGGFLIETGFDINVDGILDPGEATGSTYLCLPDPLATGPTPVSGLVFASTIGAALTDQLFRINPDGSNLVAVTEPHYGGTQILSTAISPNQQWIAYASDEVTPGNSSMLVRALDGSLDAVNISPYVQSLASNGTSVGWSFDSSWFAYVARQSTANLELYINRPDGSDNRLISWRSSNENGVSSARWSPSGEELAFLSVNPEGVSTLYVYTPSTGALVEIHPFDSTNDCLGGFSPTPIFTNPILYFAWSPDGAKLAFGSAHCIDNSPGLYTVSKAGENLVQYLPAATVQSPGSVTWSPDSSYLAYIKADEASPFDTRNLYVATYYNGGQLFMPSPLNITGFPMGDGNFVDSFQISPLSTRILYSGSKAGIGYLSISGSDGSGTSDILPAQDIFYYSWSGDGTRAAVISQTSGTLIKDMYVFTDQISPVASNLTSLSTGPGVMDFIWSLDSSMLTYRAEHTGLVGGDKSLHAIMADGSLPGIRLSLCCDPFNPVEILPGYHWTADSSQVIYNQEGNFSMKTVASDGSGDSNILPINNLYVFEENGYTSWEYLP